MEKSKAVTGDTPVAGEPGNALDTIARQQQEIERLHGLLATNGIAEELHDAFVVGATSQLIATSVAHERLLEMIVETATQVIGARASSLFLVDNAAQHLVVAVATGPKAGAARGITAPFGHGLVGLVSMTGQAMAISDASHDPRAARDIMERVGYMPNSMVAVPIVHEEGIVGVLEMLDKVEQPSFSASDMAVLGLFASQITVALEQSHSHQVFLTLIEDALRGNGAPVPTRAVEERVDAFVTDIETDPVYGRSVELARLVRRIVSRGENEYRGCEAILRGFADYLDSRSDHEGLMDLT